MEQRQSETRKTDRKPPATSHAQSPRDTIDTTLPETAGITRQVPDSKYADDNPFFNKDRTPRLVESGADFLKPSFALVALTTMVGWVALPLFHSSEFVVFVGMAFSTSLLFIYLVRTLPKGTWASLWLKKIFGFSFGYRDSSSGSDHVQRGGPD